MERLSFRNFDSCIEYLKTSPKKKIIFGCGQLGREWAYGFFSGLGVDIAGYCDNNSKLWGKTINDINIYSPQELGKSSADVIVLLIIRWDAIDDVSKQLESMGIKQILDYPTIINLEGIKDYFFSFTKKKIAVYTCVTDGYDVVRNHEYISDSCDYYYISDAEQEGLEGVKFLNIYDYLPKEVADPTRQNRYCKINAHKIFPDYRYSIYADANTIFTKDLTCLVKELPKTRIAVAANLLEDDVYLHAIRVMNSKRDDPDIIRKQMEHYWIQGMPDKFGCYWCNVLIREHNNPVCVKLMEEWWEQVDSYSRRDQLSLPYVIWKNGYRYEDVGIIDKEFHTRLLPKYWKYGVEHSKPWVIYRP